MKKYFDQSEKSKAIDSSMPIEMQQKLDKHLEILEERSKANHSINRILNPIKRDFSDLRFDENISLTDMIEAINTVKHLPDPDK